MHKIKNCIIILLILILSQSCVDYKLVDEDSFLGKWELKGRDVYSNMNINIVRKDNKLVAYVDSIPDSYYGNIFIKKNTVWISNIKRTSNFQFKITEKKIASELFSLYGLDTKTVFYATFSENKNKIYLTKKNSNKSVQESKVYYERVK